MILCLDLTKQKKIRTTENLVFCFYDSVQDKIISINGRNIWTSYLDFKFDCYDDISERDFSRLKEAYSATFAGE